MESSASGELGVIGPIMLMIFLAGFSLALIWLFGEPQRSRGSTLDEPRSADRSSKQPPYPADPAKNPGGQKRPTARRQAPNPARNALERWGCFSRRVLRVVLQHLSQAVAVVSFGILAGTAIAILWRWIFGD